MEWFGLTMYGFPDDFKDLMRDDYKEPTVQRTLSEEIEHMSKQDGAKPNFSQLISELDCYIGHADGYSYGSYDRLLRMRKKGIVKPVGPNDMYKQPATNAMKFGWWINDSDVVRQDWYKPYFHHAISTSPMSRYVNKVLKVDKYFRL